MRIFPVAVLSLAAFLSLAAPAQADISPEQVRRAIDLGVAYLKRSQNNNGTWTDTSGYIGGTTALCTLALLNSGMPIDEESMRKSLTYLRNLRPNQTYVVALQTMVFCAAEPKRDLFLIRRNVKWLEDNQVSQGDNRGGWSYPSASGDPSNSQFALLALFEAQRAGVPVAERTWKFALQYWQGLQNPDGSWPYTRGRPGTGSMTCAGITSLVIAAGETSSGDADVEGDTVKCCSPHAANENVESGLHWLERNFSVHSNPGGAANANWLLYYLYGVERTGRMTARRFIGLHDWYREGTDMLVRTQDNLLGFWRGSGAAEADPNIGTSFALLFLAKGRRPVLIAKVKHPPSSDWDNHRSDLANLTSYVEKKWERDLTWQVVDAAAASVEDLLQAPVLFINGRRAPQFTAEQKLRLRDYVDRGGFLFVEACCDGREFEFGARELLAEIFPESEYKLRLLPPEHPIWHAEEPVNPNYLRPLYGIDVGCRTSVVFSPGELSCFWELGRPARRTELPPRVQDDVDAALAIGANVLAYATNREVKYKFEHFTTPPGEGPHDNFDRGKLYAARLQHPGGCNAAPQALPTLLRLAGEKLQLRVSPEVRELTISDPKLFGYHLVFMHGRHNFRLTPQEREQLKTYLERGGMLFADAICSSREFTEAFTREIKSLFPEARMERIPPGHPLFTAQFGGDDLTSVSRREPLRGAQGGPMRSEVRQQEPFLEGLKLGDRYAVIFSPYDISCALESHESLECEGYTRADAARIGLNVLVYSLHH